MKHKKLLATFSAAFALAMSAELAATESVSTFSVDAGYRHGHAKREINLNLPVPGGILTGPIKHNTKYNLWDIQLWSRTILDNEYYIKANVGYGHVYKASEVMNCTNLSFSGLPIGTTPGNDVWGRKRTVNKKHGSAYNVLLGVGYLFPVNDSCVVIPTIGFEHQEMTIKKYMNESTTYAAKANVKQKERWSGLFVGVEMPISMESGLRIVPSIQYTFAKYKTSTTNRLSGPDCRYYYQGSKHGHIIKAGLEAFMPINDQWTIDAGYNFQRKSSKPTFQTQYVVNSTASNGIFNGKNSKGKVRINEHSLNLGLTFAF